MAVSISDVALNKIKVKFKSAPIQNVRAEVAREMQMIKPCIKPQMRIAVGVGSRGIDNIAMIVKEVVDSFTAFGGLPFIVPAMGSHGGATAEGQALILKEYGITQETMGVPVLSSMKVKNLGALHANQKMSLFMDQYAYEADGVFVINRVKPHTDFRGPNESGIAKMLVVGLGKHAQALAIHEHLIDGLRNFIPQAAQAITDTGKIIGALAIVEDGYDKTSVIKAARAEDIVKTDAELLLLAGKMMPSLPFERLDLLLVDYLGKNISGTGMDTNIIGRIHIPGVEDRAPHITGICLFDITPQCHGNALGVGLADIIPQRLYDKIDWQATYENVITSRFLRRGFVPIIQPTDRDVVATGLKTCGFRTKDTLRLARIRDTLHIDEIYVTHALLEDLEGNGDIEVLERELPLAFSADGTLQKL